MQKREDTETTQIHDRHKAEPHAEGEENRTAESGVESSDSSHIPAKEKARRARSSKHAKEVDHLKAQLAEAQDRYLRTLAEFDNFRKRTERENISLIQAANADLIVSLLPVVDDLERSLQAAKESRNFEAMYKGIELVYQNFLKVLESFGVQPIDAVGKPFDPEVHEAVFQMDSDSEPGTVVQEHQRGYRLRERVIRPSQVIVSR